MTYEDFLTAVRARSIDTDKVERILTIAKNMTPEKRSKFLEEVKKSLEEQVEKEKELLKLFASTENDIRHEERMIRDKKEQAESATDALRIEKLLPS